MEVEVTLTKMDINTLKRGKTVSKSRGEATIKLIPFRHRRISEHSVMAIGKKLRKSHSSPSVKETQPKIKKEKPAPTPAVPEIKKEEPDPTSAVDGSAEVHENEVSESPRESSAEKVQPDTEPSIDPGKKSPKKSASVKKTTKKKSTKKKATRKKATKKTSSRKKASTKKRTVKKEDDHITPTPVDTPSEAFSDFQINQPPVDPFKGII
jgi:hypothetical protein